MKKALIIVLIVILSMLVWSFTKILIASTKGSFSGPFWNSRAISRDDEYKVREESIDIYNIQDIDLYLRSSDVRVVLSDDEQMKLVQYSNSKEDSKKISIDKTNTRIRIEEEKRIYFFAVLPTDLFDIYIPKTYANNLKIDAGSSSVDNLGDIILKKVNINLASGDINLKNTVNIEDLRINTASGDVEIERLEGKKLDINTASGDVNFQNELKSEEARIKTISGNIEISDVNSNTLSLETTSGEIEANKIYSKLAVTSVSGEIKIGYVEGNLEGKTTSGDILINKFLINNNSKISSVSGEVNIELDKNSNCIINTKSVSGDTSFPNGKNVIGKEPYNSFEISTTSGDINIGEI